MTANARENGATANLSGGGEIICSCVMDQSAILARLKEHEAELRRRGVARVALFGSVARGEAREGSDIDLMVDIDPNAGETLSSLRRG